MRQSKPARSQTEQRERERLSTADRLRNMFSVKELARLTGEAEVTWRCRLRRGDLTYYKLGFGRNAPVRVARKDLEDWLDERRIPADLERGMGL